MKNKSHHPACFLFLIVSLLFAEDRLLASACDHEDHDIGQDVSNHRHLEDDVDEECGFEDPTEEEMEEENLKLLAWRSSRSSLRASYNIPVYFHIIQPSRSETMVPDERVNAYLNYLNDAYSPNTAFSFSLAGITRTVDETWSNNGYEHSFAYKSKLKEGGRDVLNVYICNKVPKSNGAFLAGFAYLPTSKVDPVLDGVVISRTNPGDSRRLNTLVHEVGHFLGLGHTFSRSCDVDGDGVPDTPLHLSSAKSVNCHTDPSTWDTCPNRSGRDPVDNYMSEFVV